MANNYNPYSEIKKVYDAKVAWNNATTEEERKKQNDIANNARKTLEAYGYGDVANQISASGANATTARKILESYAPTAPASTNLSNAELITKNNNETRNKINQLWGIQTNDHSDTQNLWKREYEDLKSTNPFTTEEAKAILAKYDLSGLQARDNAAASGSATNGGNIDSYAAANALRQQAALVNQGQTSVLNAYQQKLDNARSILEGLGAYQQNNYSSMQNTIGLQSNEGQRLFENDETAKNNEAARLEVQASVTGNIPKQWQYSNNPYFNSDGTLNEVYMSDSFDNAGGFTTIINNAKSRLAKTTDAEERANLQATINYATQAKAYKTYSNPKYAAYAHEVEGVASTPTETKRQFDETMQYNYALIDAEKDMNKANNQNTLDQIVTSAQYGTEASGLSYNDIVKMLKQTTTPSQELIDAYNAVSMDATTYTTENPPPMTGTEIEGSVGYNFLGDGKQAKTEKEKAAEDLTTLKSNFSEQKIKDFIDAVIKPYIDNSWEINEDVIQKLIVGRTDGTVVENSNSEIYNLDIEDARKICNALGLDASWVDKFTNRTWFNAGKGMKAKEE